MWLTLFNIKKNAKTNLECAWNSLNQSFGEKGIAIILKFVHWLQEKSVSYTENYFPTDTYILGLDVPPLWSQWNAEGMKVAYAIEWEENEKDGQ